MSLTLGTRLGPYEVTALIGAGGMGEVYRATDTNLKRSVAIKILPEAFAGDPERLARFQREAEVLARLNHPNIAAIYGLERSDSGTAIVMELVEGPTLADRVAKGPVPVDEAFPIAKQMAEALDAAHEQGVIHRDLKPANIKVRPDGAVKVLDFGLAKALEPTGAMSPGMSQSPTITSPAMTQHGVILGTATYMSPEQARGKPVDKRTDIWAFGCVLYEMLTGKRAFDGEDVTEILGRIVTTEPDWNVLPGSVPAALAMFLRRCLQKDRKQRIDSAQVLRLALEGAFETAWPPTAVAVESRRGTPWQRALSWAAVVVLGGLLVSAAGWALAPSATRSVARFEVTAVPLSTRPFVAVSPDGTRIVYGTRVQGRTHLYVRRLDQLAGTSLLSTDQDVFSPVVSPDGAWVAFVTNVDNTWKKVSMLGGPPVTLAPARALDRGASWGPDDTIIVGEDQRGLWRVPAAGGDPTMLTTPDATRGEIAHGWPEVLPGGRAVLFTIVKGIGVDNLEIAALNLTTGEQRIVLRGGSRPRYVPSGHLMYGVNGTLMAVPFDRDRLELAGTAVPVVEGVLTNFVSGVVAEFSLSADGSLVYVASANPVGRQSLVWVDREGREEAISAPYRAYTSPRISPDGTKVALSLRDEEEDIWIWDFARDTLTRLTFDPGLDRQPVWSPDGRRIAFSSTRDKSRGNLFWQAADGTGTVERLAESNRQGFPTAFAPDGTRLLVYLALTQNDGDIAVVQPGGEPRAVPLLATTFRERFGELSPDGRWLAYNSNESGRDEVYVRPFPDVDTGRWQVSTGGGNQPVWARNGRELFFRSNAALMSVPVQTGQTFAAGSPAVVFEGEYAAPVIGGRTYDVSPDGRRFLMMKEGAADDNASRAQIILVQNFFEELKRLVP